eukprot:470717-Rhodomonas_salina.2
MSDTARSQPFPHHPRATLQNPQFFLPQQQCIPWCVNEESKPQRLTAFEPGCSPEKATDPTSTLIENGSHWHETSPPRNERGAVGV